jgi:hypothetical protein
MSGKVFGAASEKQLWFLKSDANIIVYGGELAPPFKTLLNGES